MPTEASRMLRCRGFPQALGSKEVKAVPATTPRQTLAVFKGLFLPTQFSIHCVGSGHGQLLILGHRRDKVGGKVSS